MRIAAFFFAAVVVAPAQSSSPPGVTPAWELKKQLDGLVAQTRRLTPLLEQVKPQDWGADGYREQHKSAQAEVEYLARSAAALAAEPEKMTLALESFLRLEGLERMLDSLSEGVRRYQNPALAELIQGSISENLVHRARLRNYLTELVATKQDELRIATDEAQSCRATAITSPKKPAHTTNTTTTKPVAPSTKKP